jgi:phospholipase/carboxylesterase
MHSPQAPGALILVHGRGATAHSILELAPLVAAPDMLLRAPQAPGNSWYPQSFLAPIQSNQPYLDQSLATLESLVAELAAEGLSSDRVALLGFSQGACLTLEFVARFPRRYGAVIAFTGGLIRPLETPGTLEGTPVWLSSGDPDGHVPFARVQQSAEVLTAMGAAVELRRYPGKPHSINQEEIDAARRLVSAMTKEKV